MRTYEGLDTCFISKSQVAILKSPYEIQLVSAQNKEDKSVLTLKLNKSMNIKNIFSSTDENVLIFTTNDCIAQYDTKNNKILGQ